MPGFEDLPKQLREDLVHEILATWRNEPHKEDFYRNNPQWHLTEDFIPYSYLEAKVLLNVTRFSYERAQEYLKRAVPSFVERTRGAREGFIMDILQAWQALSPAVRRTYPRNLRELGEEQDGPIPPESYIRERTLERGWTLFPPEMTPEPDSPQPGAEEVPPSFRRSRNSKEEN
jgi:hypothetical protein